MPHAINIHGKAPEADGPACRRKDYETGGEGFTLGAALVLGKDEVIASIAPAYKTDAYVQCDNSDRYNDRRYLLLSKAYQ